MKYKENILRLAYQIFRFGIVGFIAFFIDYFLLIFLTDFVGVYYLLSSVISFTVSLVFNYVASMRYVFKSKKSIDKKKEFYIFVILSLIGLGINQSIMWFGVGKIDISYKLVKIFATAVVMVWNFVTRKIFLEEKKTP